MFYGLFLATAANTVMELCCRRRHHRQCPSAHPFPSHFECGRRTFQLMSVQFSFKLASVGKFFNFNTKVLRAPLSLFDALGSVALCSEALLCVWLTVLRLLSLAWENLFKAESKIDA